MKKLCSISLALMATMYLASTALASGFPTNVQFNVDGSAGYDILNVKSVDWDPSGSTAIENTLVSSSNGVTTLSAFFAAPAIGDTLTMKFHSNDNLQAFVQSNGTNVYPTSSYEVTSTYDGIETAEVTGFDTNGNPTINFTSISGTFNFYLDDGSGVAHNALTGAGYNDGSNFLSGTIDSISSGSFFTGGTVGYGSNKFISSVTSYNSSIIQTDPAVSGVSIAGLSFESTLSYTGSHVATTGIGDPFGTDPYKLQDGDLVLSTDGNTTSFSAVPEPTTMLLFGMGLFGLAGFKRKRS
jgi:hypothetical protein